MQIKKLSRSLIMSAIALSPIFAENMNQDGSLIASSAIHKNADDILQVSFGDMKTAKVRLIIYSAATCKHCAEYHEVVVPKLMDYVKNGKLQLIFRTFVAHSPWDLLAAKISWIHGANKHHEYFTQMLNHQDFWLSPVAYNSEDPKEKQAYIDKLEEALVEAAAKINVKVSEIREKLDITQDDPAGFLKIFALTHLNLNIDELSENINDHALGHKILESTLTARDGDKTVNFTPAMYVETYPFDQNLPQLEQANVTIERLEELLALTEKTSQGAT
ncbi:MAG: thioredoxin domain-containing protein [Alphaproteobacteria bacterium]|nr:thioredoxin domain-containing protein [Alphaproteobacteria bacterium]